MRMFVGRDPVECFHSDSARELNAAAKGLGWLVDPSPPFEPQSNGIIENAMKQMKRGTKSALLHAAFHQSGGPLPANIGSCRKIFTGILPKQIQCPPTSAATENYTQAMKFLSELWFIKSLVVLKRKCYPRSTQARFMRFS